MQLTISDGPSLPADNSDVQLPIDPDLEDVKTQFSQLM